MKQLQNFLHPSVLDETTSKHLKSSSTLPGGRISKQIVHHPVPRETTGTSKNIFHSQVPGETTSKHILYPPVRLQKNIVHSPVPGELTSKHVKSSKITELGEVDSIHLASSMQFQVN